MLKAPRRPLFLGAEFFGLFPFESKGRFQLVRIHQVLGPSGSDFRGEEVFQAGKVRGDAPYIEDSPMSPASVEFHTGDTFQDVESVWGDSHDQECLSLGEEPFGYPGKWGREFFQRGADRAGSGRRGRGADAELQHSGDCLFYRVGRSPSIA